MQPAPIVLFVYNRLDHLKQTVNALQKNELAQDSPLIIYSDAPKNSYAKPAIHAVREFIRTINGFKSVEIIEQATNRRLAPLLIEELPKVLARFGRVIVLEDDIVTSPYFLRFMNAGLEKYADDDRVISIHGYVYPLDEDIRQPFFLKGADCWGWATWKRGWQLFEADSEKLYSSLVSRGLLERLDFFGAYGFSSVLKSHVDGAPDGWDIRWYASALLHDKLTLCPGRPLAKNIGFDGSGMHCGNDCTFDVHLCMEPIKVDKIPVEENHDILMAYSRFLHQVSHPKLITRIMRRLRRMARYR